MQNRYLNVGLERNFEEYSEWLHFQVFDVSFRNENNASIEETRFTNLNKWVLS